MNRLRGKCYKLANGYDSYDFSEGEAYLVPELAILLQRRFHFTPQTNMLLSFEGNVYIEYEHFHLGWDNWSGLFLFAKSEEGNRVLDEIAAEVEGFVNDLVDREARGDVDKDGGSDSER